LSAARREPAGPIEKARRKQHAGIRQEIFLAVAGIDAVDLPLALFVPSDPMAAAEGVERAGRRRSRGLREEPAAHHRGVDEEREVVSEAQARAREHRGRVDRANDRQHPVVADEHDDGIAVEFQRACTDHLAQSIRAVN
jgi:hypothetical protein